MRSKYKRSPEETCWPPAAIGLQARPLPFGLGNHLAHNLVAYDLETADIENAGFVCAAAAIEIDPKVHCAAAGREL